MNETPYSKKPKSKAAILPCGIRTCSAGERKRPCWSACSSRAAKPGQTQPERMVQVMKLESANTLKPR